jgi:hypothetical protein
MKEFSRDFHEADSLIVCQSGRVLFAANAILIEAYMRGLTEQELLADLSAPSGSEKAGTTMGTRYEQTVKAIEQYKAGGSFGRVSERVGALSPSEWTQLQQSPVMWDLAQDAGRTERMRSDIDKSISWNTYGARRIADGVQAVATGIGTAFGIANAEIPWAPIAGAGIGKGIGDGTKGFLDRSSDINKMGSQRMQELLPTRNSCTPDVFPGGVDGNWRAATIDDGNWPFRPFFGLLYKG